MLPHHPAKALPGFSAQHIYLRGPPQGASQPAVAPSACLTLCDEPCMTVVSSPCSGTSRRSSRSGAVTASTAACRSCGAWCPPPSRSRCVPSRGRAAPSERRCLSLVILPSGSEQVVELGGKAPLTNVLMIFRSSREDKFNPGSVLQLGRGTEMGIFRFALGGHGKELHFLLT